MAWDPVRQREAWRVEHPDPISGGTLATAGGLVFQGRADGRFGAYRATDGQLLWERALGVGIQAAPITYTVGGEQYVAILAGWGGPGVLWNAPLARGRRGRGMLVAFKLGGTATVTPDILPTPPPVPTPTASIAATPDDIAGGTILYQSRCARCHGGNVVNGGLTPDLRYSTAAVHAEFERIVLGGARMALGMPSFDGDLTPAQARLIQAYVLDRARAAAARPSRRENR